MDSLLFVEAGDADIRLESYGNNALTEAYLSGVVHLADLAEAKVRLARALDVEFHSASGRVYADKITPLVLKSCGRLSEEDIAYLVANKVVDVAHRRAKEKVMRGLKKQYQDIAREYAQSDAGILLTHYDQKTRDFKRKGCWGRFVAHYRNSRRGSAIVRHARVLAKSWLNQPGFGRIIVPIKSLYREIAEIVHDRVCAHHLLDTYLQSEGRYARGKKRPSLVAEKKNVYVSLDASSSEGEPAYANVCTSSKQSQLDKQGPSSCSLTFARQHGLNRSSCLPSRDDTESFDMS